MSGSHTFIFSTSGGRRSGRYSSSSTCTTKHTHSHWQPFSWRLSSCYSLHFENANKLELSNGDHLHMIKCIHLYILYCLKVPHNRKFLCISKIKLCIANFFCGKLQLFDKLYGGVFSCSTVHHTETSSINTSPEITQLARMHSYTCLIAHV